MTLQKPDLHLLTVWRIRLLLCTMVPSFLSAYFLPRLNWVWWLFTAAWVLAFLGFYIFYYPIKFRKLSYSANANCLLIHCGVIYTRVKAVPLTSVQYVSVGTTPLQRLFGICSLFVYTAGSSSYIPGLAPDRAEELRELLTPARLSADKGGGTDA